MPIYWICSVLHYIIIRERKRFTSHLLFQNTIMQGRRPWRWTTAGANNLPLLNVPLPHIFLAQVGLVATMPDQWSCQLSVVASHNASIMSGDQLRVCSWSAWGSHLAEAKQFWHMPRWEITWKSHVFYLEFHGGRTAGWKSTKINK